MTSYGKSLWTLLFGFLLLFAGTMPAYANDAPHPSSGLMACAEKTVWDGKEGNFIQVKECKISCSGGSTSITCGANDKCDCECRSSGLPGCSCHPGGRQLMDFLQTTTNQPAMSIAVSYKSAH